MGTLASPALPRLGDSFAAYSLWFGLPVRTTTAAGHVLRSYHAEGGSLTVLFSQGKSVGLRVPYPTPMPSPAALTALAEAFIPAKGSACRLLLADGGWLLATEVCAPACIDALTAA